MYAVSVLAGIIGGTVADAYIARSRLSTALNPHRRRRHLESALFNLIDDRVAGHVLEGARQYKVFS